jgi:hypothetical protein
MNTRHPTLVATAAVLVAVPAWAVQPDDATAAELLESGIELYREGDAAAALLDLEAALLADPSDWRILYFMGMALHDLGRYVEAGERLEAFLAKGGEHIAGEVRTEVEEVLGTVEKMTGKIVVDPDVAGAYVYIDGRHVKSGALAVDPGEHEVEVRAEGHQPFEETVTVKGGRTVVVEATMLAHGQQEEPEEPPAPAPPAGDVPEDRAPIPAGVFWAGVGLSGALLAAACVTGALALATDDRYAAMDAGDDWRPVRSRLVALSVAADALIGATAAVAAATVVMAFFTDLGRERSPARAAIAAGPGEPGLSLRIVY